MEPSVEIDVRGGISPDYHLDITLINQSAHPLTTYQYSLPWGGRYSILLIAVKTDAGGTVLDRSWPIDDPGPAIVTIKPSETLTGKILLVSRFPGFLEALKERDVVVFWSYQFQSIEGDSLSRVGGCVLFSKSSKA